jgi:hypothetical protein
LAKLCDRLGNEFAGVDIELWLVPMHDPRVIKADARDPLSYPSRPFTTVTSPTYANTRFADYADGPTPNTKFRGRRDYALSLGRALHPDNLARYTGRSPRPWKYWEGHRDIVKHWDGRVLLNVDGPISDRWQQLLVDAGYHIHQVIPVKTRRYGGLDNAEVRAEHEVVIEALRNWAPPAPPSSRPRRLIRRRRDGVVKPV